MKGSIQLLWWAKYSSDRGKEPFLSFTIEKATTSEADYAEAKVVYQTS